MHEDDLAVEQEVASSDKELSTNELVFRERVKETRTAFDKWRQDPFNVPVKWLLLSAGISAFMLIGIYIIASFTVGQYTSITPTFTDSLAIRGSVNILKANILVLLLHTFICFAGFLSMSAMPAQAKHKSGIDQWVHAHAGKFTLIWVAMATCFSIATQIYFLGLFLADLSSTLHVSNLVILISVLPHAMVELTAMFLPLAAFLRASKRGEWDQLLAATVVTFCMALPMLIIAALLETYLWPHTLSLLS